MSPRPDSTLLFPALRDDDHSTRNLDQVGAVAVLGALVRRQTSHAPVRVREGGAKNGRAAADVVSCAERACVGPSSDVFQKVR
jgi:hypothetical protein